MSFFRYAFSFVILFVVGLKRNNQATALSLIPSEIIQNVNPKSRLFAQHLLKLASYWSNLFGSSEDGSLNEDLESVICNAQSRKALFPNSKNMLLTAAFRALSVRTRLVCSLHPVPLSLSLAHSYSETLNPIHVWSEVYDSHEKEWIPVHGAKGLVKDHLKYVLATPHLQSHVSYVIAFDGTFGVKDVTQRYTSQWGAKTAKLRLSGDDGERWFNRLLNRYAKDWHDVKEQVDETHLQQAQVSEQMPTNLAGFKDHPIYALERHLKKFEAIHPLGVAHSVGRFKNDLVYPRSLVKRLSSREGWLRDGQKVKDNEVPHKVVQKKTRKDDDEDGIPRPSTELYGEWQTSQYEPPELVDVSHNVLFIQVVAFL